MKNKNKQNSEKIWKWDRGIKQNLSLFITRIKRLQGDPHYIAMGMAIGVFVSVTPTIPFHTIIAVLFAFLLKGSKPAAIIGVWFSNPVTIPIFYVGSYKTGKLLIGNSSSELQKIINFMETIESQLCFEAKYQVIANFFTHELKLACAMIIGGIILGIIPGIAAYFITRKVFVGIRELRD